MFVGIKQAKSILRNEIKQRLKTLSSESIKNQSFVITKQLLESNCYKESSRIGIYLSLPEEVQTYDILDDIFKSEKQCFIPRYTKTEMVMVKLQSLEDMENLPVTAWNIKQPLESEERENALFNGGLDLVIVPGLAFTKQGDRLGRGKGYYDKYLHNLKEFQVKTFIKAPYTVGLAFKEQIVQEIPTSEEDFKIDTIFFPKDNF